MIFVPLRYMNVTEDHIPQEDLFLYRYMQKKFQSISAEKMKEEEGEESDNESVGSDEFQEMLYGKNKNSDDDEDEDENSDEGDSEEAEVDFEKEAEEGAKKKGKKKTKRQRREEEEEEDFSDEEEDGMPSDFASAEQFAEMLQTAGIEELDAGGSSAVRNTDNAHAKQLKWEQDRWTKTKTGAKRKQRKQPNGVKSKKRRVKK